MASGAPAAEPLSTDPLVETRRTRRVFWVRYLRLGLLISLLTAGALFAYLGLAPHRPHEQALRGIGLFLVASAAALAVLPTDRVVQSRWRWPFFYTWSLLDVALIGWAAWLDGGGTSPLTVAFVLPVLYAAMAYPPGGVVGVAAATLAGFGAACTGGGPGDASYDVLVGSVLGLSGLMAFVGARHRAFEQRALAGIRQRLAVEATADPLTGCLNRRAFLEVLAAEAARATRHGRPLALLAVDVDRFKEVNDTHGHPAGDAVLVALADVLRRHTRIGDTVARLGGDEFSIVLPECRPDDAEGLALRLRAAAVAAAGLPPVRISVGVAVADGSRPADPDELVAEADRALYATKRARAARATARPPSPPAEPEPRGGRADQKAQA